MARLWTQLSARGDSYDVDREWVGAYQREHRATLADALLHLDLVDEQGLLRALAARFELSQITPAVIAAADPSLPERLPPFLRRTGSICPLQLVGDELLIAVTRPLSSKMLRRLRSLGLEARQLAAAPHHVATARQRVFGVPVDARTAELEARLARRRALSLRRALMRAESASPERARAVAVDLAAELLDFACVITLDEGTVRVHEASDGRARQPVKAPPAAAAMAAVLSSAEAFVGPLAASDGDRAFFESLARPVPRWVYAAPLPVADGAGDARAYLYADNGERGMAARWIAELGLLLARLSPTPDAASVADGASEDTAVAPAADGAAPASGDVGLRGAERAVLHKLQAAADGAGLPLDVYVERLHQMEAREGAARDGRAEQVAPSPDAITAKEVRELIDGLARDLPKHLADGVATALRQMGPRAASPLVGTPAAAPRAPVGTVELVSAGGPREVGHYRSRRKASKRIKL